MDNNSGVANAILSNLGQVQVLEVNIVVGCLKQ